MEKLPFQPLPVVRPPHRAAPLLNQTELDSRYLNQRVAVLTRHNTARYGVVRIVSARSRKAYVKFDDIGGWSVSLAALQMAPAPAWTVSAQLRAWCRHVWRRALWVLFR